MYDIIRFRRDGGRKKLIHKGITLEQAQEWCESEYTRKEGVYFDGYTETGKFERLTPKYTRYFTPTKQYN